MNLHYDKLVKYDSSPRRNKAGNDAESGLPEVLVSFDCGVCNRPVSNAELRFKCAECKDFGLCADCFERGKETKEHKKTHAYRVLLNLSSERISKQSTWGLDEELLLFEGIELYGLGNWDGVATHVTTKSKEECEEHYMEVYVHGLLGVPVPEKSKEIIRKEKAVERKLRKAQVDKKDMAGADVVGYMPLRREFDVEYQNEAERLISNLAFEKEEYLGDKIAQPDIVERRKSKLDMVRKYNDIVDERMRRKAFVHTYELLRWRNRRRRNRKVPKEELEIRRLMMPLARYVKRQDFDELIQGILKEQALREEVAFLKECTDRGLKTMQEAEEFRRDTAYAGTAANSGPSRSRRKEPERTVVSRSGRKSKRRRTYTGTYAEDPGDPLDTLDELDDSDLDAKPAYRHDGFDYSTLHRYIQPKKAQLSAGLKISPKDLIAASERSLCSMLKIDAWQYVKVKSILLEECVRQKIFIKKKDGSLRAAEKGNQMVLVDISKSGKNLDFHVRVMTPAAVPYRNG